MIFEKEFIDQNVNKNRYEIINSNQHDYLKICTINNSEIIRLGINEILKEEQSSNMLIDVSKSEFNQVWTQTKFDLIITDIEFNGIVDVDYISQIRSEHPEAKIIVHTNHRNNSFRTRSLNEGASFFIYFDKNLNLLQYIVRRVLTKIAVNKNKKKPLRKEEVE